jgi:4-amino-4-deoxy-L-arabinose transferase-like glycosyltransferase
VEKKSFTQQLRNHAPLFFILLLCVIVRIPTLLHPILDIDESQYGDFAVKLLQGGIPYLDAVGEKPPLLYYFYAAAFAMFGWFNYIGLHFLTMLWVLATLIAMYATMTTVFSRRVGLFAILLYTLFHTTHEPSFLASNGETLMNLPLLVGMYMLARFLKEKQGQRAWFFWVMLGLSWGVAFLFRQQAALHMVSLLVLMILLLIHGLNRGHWGWLFLRKTREGMAVLVSFLLPLGIAWIWLYATSVEAFQEYFYWNWEFNQQYIKSGASLLPVGDVAFTRLIPPTVFFLPAIILAGYALGRQGGAWVKRVSKRELSSGQLFLAFLLVNFLLNIIVVCLGWRVWTHYLLFILPSLIMLAAVGLDDLWERMKVRQLRWLGTILFVITLIYTSFAFYVRTDQHFYLSIYEWIVKDSYKYVGVFPEQQDIGTWIHNHSDPDDTIFIWGFQTTIAAYAQREIGYRISWTDFMVGNVPGVFMAPGTYHIFNLGFWDNVWKTIPNPASDPSKWREFWHIHLDRAWDYFWEDMERYKPRYIIDTAPAGYHWYDVFPMQNYSYANLHSKRFALWDFVQQYYKPVHTIHGVVIYERVNSSAN